MSFLPEDYEAPRSSLNYMKIEDGEHKIRILSSPIFGWEDWIDGKPVRYRFDQKPAKSFDMKKPVRHFWALIVWNYREERIQILQICQATIRTALEALSKDSEWGAPFFYDVKIKRLEEKGKTKYIINPLPHKDLDAVIKMKFHESPCCLEALFEGADPFAAGYSKYTQGVFDKSIQTTQVFESSKQEKIALISSIQTEELKEIFLYCDQEAFVKLLNDLKLSELRDLPAILFDKMKAKALKMRKEKLDADALSIFGSLEVANV